MHAPPPEARQGLSSGIPSGPLLLGDAPVLTPSTCLLVAWVKCWIQRYHEVMAEQALTLHPEGHRRGEHASPVT